MTTDDTAATLTARHLPTPGEMLRARADAGELRPYPDQDICLDITQHIGEIGVLLHQLWQRCFENDDLAWDISSGSIFDIDRLNCDMFRRLKAIDAVMQRRDRYRQEKRRLKL